MEWRTEFDPVSVFKVAHNPPGRFSRNCFLISRNTFVGVAFLKFHRIHTCADSNIDKPLGYIYIAVMIQPDFTYDKTWRPLTY